ncbi:MAG: hypothetical protein ACRC8F_06920 [Cetobacterium sp.]
MINIFMVILSLVLGIELKAEENEVFYFRPSVKYEVKSPIEIESNMNVVDFGTIIYGNTGVVEGHILKIKGTGNMNVQSSFNRSVNGVQILEKVKKYGSEGELEVQYQYIWDTSKSDVKDLNGTRVTFTAYYE